MLLARLRPPLLGVATLVAALVLACGGSDDESTPASTSDGAAASTPAATESSSSGDGDIDVCSLLTAADLDAATEQTWGEGVFNQSLSSDQQFICDWLAADGGFATAQVLVHPTDATFEGNRGNAESIFGLAEAPSIAGADDAYATAEGSIIGMKIAGRFLQVSYIPPDPGTVLEATTQLAQAVADRM